MAPAGPAQVTTTKNFWDKNKQLNRPMSPFHVYKIQITSGLSISHRLTGIGVSVLLYGGGIAAIFCTDHTFPELIQIVQNAVPQSLILASKTAVGGGLLYHTLNGVRHLFWDVGYGFKLKHLYYSGYAVVGMTALGTLIIYLQG